MRGNFLCTAALLICAQSVYAAEHTHTELKDPHFGEALYYAYQGEFFDAIARLDTELTQFYGVDEPELDTLNFHINEAEFSVGDFELSYRMHRKAGRAIKAVIEGNVAPEVRNEALYRLARIYFQKEQNLNALHTIERIEGDLPPRHVDDIAFLKAQIYMVNGKFSEAAGILSSLEGRESYEGFAAYNLGVALFAQGKEEEGVLKLDEAGQIGSSDDAAVKAIKDKANLVLGSRLMDMDKEQTARQYFSRVRLDGPFSNKALLGLGWASARDEDYKRALVPWTMLSERNVTDSSVQEAVIGVPYAYGKLGLYGKAALMYGSALESIGKELDKLDASIKSIKEGKFLKAMVREEIKKDRNWVIRLRELPESPETYYLMDLMASHDFQSSLQNYLDLERLRKRLESWASYYDSYEEIIAIRRQYYEPLLPELDEQFRKLNSRINLRVEQRDKINSRLQNMLIAPRPEFLATAPERIIKERIAAIEKRIDNSGTTLDAQVRHRINRLKGYLLWNITTGYDKRLTETFEHLDDLNKDIARLQEIYRSYVRTRQAATQSYEGYDEQIRRLRIKTGNAIQNVETLMARQGHMLEVMAVNELTQRRDKLEKSQVKARFAMAESYDRATMKEPADKADPEAEERQGDTPEEEGDSVEEQAPDKTAENDETTEQAGQ
ncbi:MAG: tetratricopeptide repeat protein [Pseudomonadota bacterium]